MHVDHVVAIHRHLATRPPTRAPTHRRPVAGGPASAAARAFDWWVRCTGDSGAFNDTSPLMIARWSSDPYPLPNWPTWTMWQYTSAGHVDGVGGNVDRNVFNGSLSRLRALARCTAENPC